MDATQRLLSVQYPISEHDVKEYNKNGHLLLRGIVPKALLADFRKAILESHEALLTPEDRLPAVSAYDKAFRLTENLWEVNDVIKTHVLSQRYAGIARKLLGCRDVRVYHDLTFFKHGAKTGGSVTPWHQDGHYWPLDTDKCVTIWVPLVDCPVEMGPMSFVSGSHLSRAAEHLEITDESDELIKKLIEQDHLTVAPAQDMKAGDATFHSCWTYHAAGANTSSQTREAFALVYYDADALTPTYKPTNKRRAANLAKWFPGVVPGEVAASVKNPAVLELNSGLPSVSITDIRTQSMSPADFKQTLINGIVEGMSKPYNEKTLPGLLLYDEAGLILFDKITYEPEYYLTESEITILREHAGDIASTIPNNSILIELGAGALRKTTLLLDALEAQQKSVTYYALDLDQTELERTLAQLVGKYHHVKLAGLWGTYDDGRAFVADMRRGNSTPTPVTMLWLGSSVGNMTRLEAADFVKSYGDVLLPGKDSFIIAIDGRDRSAESIRAAYNDKAGITAAFAINLLKSLNAFVGYDMVNPEAFSYDPYYNEVKGRNEAYFRSTKTQELVFHQDKFGSSSRSAELLEGELIRFAYSHKYNKVERDTLFKLARATVRKEWASSEGEAYVMSCLAW